jgi:hypothetical protein
MNDPASQQDSSIQSDKPNLNRDSSTSAIEKFWDSFRFFPKRRFILKWLDENSYRYWFVPVGTLVFIVLFAALLYDMRLNDDYSYLKRILTSWSIIPMAVALSLAALTFNIWRDSIPRTFKALQKRLSFPIRVENTWKEYLQFLEDYQQTLLSNKRYIPVSIIMIISLFISFLSTRQAILETNLALSPWRLLAVLFLLFLAVIWGYFFGVGAWGMCITGIYIKRLTAKFDLIIQPRHPDKCGGLKFLGGFCLRMALPILVGVILLGIWSIEATLFPNIITGTLLRPILLIAANSVLFLFALPLAFIAFFLPLWDIHRKMVMNRTADEDKFANRITKVEEKLLEELDHGELEKAKSAKADMDFIQSLLIVSYPTWPFDHSILLIFLAPQIVPIASLIVQISQSLIR